MLLPSNLERMKLGCRPWHPEIPLLPAQPGETQRASWPAWSRYQDAPRLAGHNDVISDCVETAAANAVQTAMAAQRVFAPIADGVIEAVYSAVTGYKQGDPATDQGTDPEAMFSWWRGNPISGYLLDDAWRVRPDDLVSIRNTIAGSGGVFVVVKLAREQFNQKAWAPAGVPGSAGLHAVWADSWVGRYFGATSWGMYQPIDEAFFTGGCVEAVYGLDLRGVAGQAVTQSLPRGVRNNNPGNIVRDGTAWKGLAATQSDPRFCVFASAAYGIRALAEVLKTYQTAHGLNTLRGIIGRWAPPTENDTGAYLADVAGRCAAGADEVIDVTGYLMASKLVAAIIAHENAGYAYPAETLDFGLWLAGINVPGTAG